MAEYREEKSATGWSFVVMALALALSITCNVLLLDKMKMQREFAIVTDTTLVVTYDTVICEMPVVRDSVVLRYETVYLPAVRDTIQDSITTAWADSVLIEIPIEQREYRDSSYHAYISGYKAKLDSIEIYHSTQYIQSVARDKDKRWHVSATIGYGLGDGGLTPFVGVGVSYSLFGF